MVIVAIKTPVQYIIICKSLMQGGQAVPGKQGSHAGWE